MLCVIYKELRYFEVQPVGILALTPATNGDFGALMWVQTSIKDAFICVMMGTLEDPYRFYRELIPAMCEVAQQFCFHRYNMGLEPEQQHLQELS